MMLKNIKRFYFSHSTYLAFASRGISNYSVVFSTIGGKPSQLKSITVRFNDLNKNSNAIFRYLLFNLKPRVQYTMMIKLNGRYISDVTFYPLNISLNEFLNKIVFESYKVCDEETNPELVITLEEVTKVTYKPFSGVRDTVSKGSYIRGVVRKENQQKDLAFPLVPKKSIQDTFKLITRRNEGLKRRAFNRFQARSGKRDFSTSSVVSSWFNGDMFYNIESYIKSKNFEASREVQLQLEQYLLDFKSEVTKTEPTLISNVDVRRLSGPVASYIDKKSPLIYMYVNALLKSNKKNDLYIISMLNRVGSQFIFDNCVYFLLKILTHRKTGNFDLLGVTSIGVKVGNIIVDKYLRLIKADDKSNFKVWRNNYIKDIAELKGILNNDDSFYLQIGTKVIEILINSELIKLEVLRVGRNERHSLYVICDPELLKMDFKDVVLVSPLRLPMIVSPEKYVNTEGGGYLLNNTSYTDSMFTDKKQYKIESKLSDNNNIISLVNNLSATPFKVNKELLYFLYSELGSSLLIQESELKEYESKQPLSKYKQKKYTALCSQFVHQNFILKIANIFKNYNSIYFPVKLDNRGRVYCIPPYFNYQSSDLAKALILFSVPGIINKNYLEDVKYLQCYGVNCFGGEMSKASVQSKINWVNDNIDNIINFENGILLRKAKEPLLFLAFCMEYKKYYLFLNDDSKTEFNSYLPVQLDATCNGFQHLSLLSQESKLYDVLNLSNKGDKPKDFYNFLLHKVLEVIKSKLDEGITIDGKGDYSRLNSFIWERNHVKKLIMTIPYNSTDMSMKKYLLDNLEQSDFDVDNNCYWYSTKDNTDLRINSYDAGLIVKILRDIIRKDFTKIHNLAKYLRNVAKLFNTLNIPIFWALPSGLNIYQSYLESKSITISPFTYSKAKLNLKVSNKDKLDHNKQVIALMPNLIHSLDAYSMTELYTVFNNKFNPVQFYSIHDCFGTTTDKVECLKNLLLMVYVDLYSNDSYLEKFDKGIINYLTTATNYKIEGRKVIIDEENSYELFDISWVINAKLLSNKEVNRLDSQYILI